MTPWLKNNFLRTAAHALLGVTLFGGGALAADPATRGNSGPGNAVTPQLTPEMRQKLSQLTPEQRQALIKQWAEKKQQLSPKEREAIETKIREKTVEAVGPRRTNRLDLARQWANNVRNAPGNTTTQGGNVGNQGGNVQSQFGNAGNQFGNAGIVGNKDAQTVRDMIDQRARGETQGLLTPGTQQNANSPAATKSRGRANPTAKNAGQGPASGQRMPAAKGNASPANANANPQTGPNSKSGRVPTGN